MRNTLKGMLREGSFSNAAVAEAVASFHDSRRAEAVSVLTSFAAGWPALNAQVIDGRRLAADLDGLTITCLPHVTVRIGTRRLALRFSYRYTDLVPDDEKITLSSSAWRSESQVLRPAFSVSWPVYSCSPPKSERRCEPAGAKPAHLITLWQAQGGSM